ncbi:hypothetical protein MKW94_025621 [Papaver nudicaule]|uniref:Ubiquitin-like protease family profile domain-containing protein n=1 Tax=Papaver nudicaule TaxID=74823 RepID=A0AA41S1I2_PAPNU|nr:hypothetical protein [Papaver nudicaule]
MKGGKFVPDVDAVPRKFGLLSQLKLVVSGSLDSDERCAKRSKRLSGKEETTKGTIRNFRTSSRIRKQDMEPEKAVLVVEPDSKYFDNDAKFVPDVDAWQPVVLGSLGSDKRCAKRNKRLSGEEKTTKGKRKKVEKFKTSSQITEQDVNSVNDFIHQNKVHGEYYNDNGKSLVNCKALFGLLHPSGWLQGDIVNKMLHLLRQSKLLPNVIHTWTYFETYILDMLRGKKVRALNKIRCGETKTSDGASLPPWAEVSKVYGVLNLNKNHWVALAIEIANKKITIYDSLRPASPCRSDNVPEEIQLLCAYLEKSTGGDWKCVYFEEIHRQTDGNSCGVFAIKFIEHMVRNVCLKQIDQNKIPRFRCEMAMQLFLQQLMW